MWPVQVSTSQNSESEHSYEGTYWRKIQQVWPVQVGNAQAAMLRIHIREHSGEKPNICDQCNYSSTQANTIYMLSWQILDTDKACIDETEMLWRETRNWYWTRADIACQCGKWTNTRINGVGKIYAHNGHCWHRYFEMNKSQNCLLLVGSYQWWLNSIQMSLAVGSCL